MLFQVIQSKFIIDLYIYLLHFNSCFHISKKTCHFRIEDY